MRPAGIHKSHDLLTCISRSADFRLERFSMVNIFVIGRFLSAATCMVAGWCFTSVRPAVSTFMLSVHACGRG